MFQPNLSVLPGPQRALWSRLGTVPEHFVLYGGTAIALRLGHRESEDFDFFSAQSFEADELPLKVPFLLGPKTVTQNQRNTYSAALHDSVGEVKLSFFGGLDFGQYFPPERCADNGVKVASLDDMMVMKVKVIHQRVAAKDYLDIAAMVRAGVSLAEGIGRLEAMFSGAVNVAMTLQSLVYFKGGDLDTLPRETRQVLIDAVRCVREVPLLTRASASIGAA